VLFDEKMKQRILRLLLTIIVLAIIIMVVVETYFLSQPSQYYTATGEIVIPPFNPKTFDYHSVLSINVSEDDVGTDLFVHWNSFFLLNSPEMVAWSVPSLIGLTTLNESQAYQSGEIDSFNFLISKVVNMPPRDSGYVVFNTSTGEIVRNSLGQSLDFIYLSPRSSTPYPYEGLTSFFAYELTAAGWSYTFTEPGQYVLIFKYLAEKPCFRCILKEASIRFNPVLRTIVNVYMHPSDSAPVRYKRFQFLSSWCCGAGWTMDKGMAYRLDNQSIFIPKDQENVTVVFTWESSIPVDVWLSDVERPWHFGLSGYGTKGNITSKLQSDTYYIVFHVFLKDALDGGIIRYDVTYPRDSGVFLWRGGYSEEQWRGGEGVTWTNEDTLERHGIERND
jgi:hypothetical protein